MFIFHYLDFKRVQTFNEFEKCLKFRICKVNTFLNSSVIVFIVFFLFAFYKNDVSSCLFHFFSFQQLWWKQGSAFNCCVFYLWPSALKLTTIGR